MLTNKVRTSSMKIRIIVFILLTTLILSTNVISVIADDTYTFSSGYSSTQGQNQWYYKQWNGSSYTNMTWNSAAGYWQGSQAYCIIGNGWVHPDTNEAVIAWKAPKAGTVTIRGSMEHIGNHDQSDGVKTRIIKNSTQVWPSSGWQDIMGGFMASHIFQVSVSANDYIYFHINKNSIISSDTTSWDPVISYTDTPKYTLDKAELVMSPTDVDNLGIGHVDTSFGVVNKGTKNDWYLTYGNESPKFNGPLNQPVETIVYKDRDPFTNPNNIDGKWWISNIYETDEGDLLAFSHIEECTSNGFWAIGISYSTNDGYTFTKCGKIVVPYIQESTPSSGNIAGVPYFIKDNYFYIYYREKGGIYGYNAVARALVSDVIAAAKNNQVIVWKKYYNGAWNENGMGGNFTPVMQDQLHHDNTVHGDAAYSTYFQKYVMAGYTHCHGKGIWLSFSSDGLSWETPTYIQHGSATNLSLSPYQTIVNIDGTDNSIVGQNFYIYYSFSQDFDDIYNHLMRHVFRQKVTLNSSIGTGGDSGYGILVPTPAPIPAGTSWVASTGFSSTQGQNQWSYNSWNGSTLTDMAWDSANSRWYGSETYCLIGNNWQHPDSTSNSDRTWTAPQAMRIRITGTVKKGVAGGDGVNVAIMGGSTFIWGTSIAPNDLTGISHDITIDVGAGTKIRFRVDKNSTNNTDTTIWDPIITKQ